MDYDYQKHFHHYVSRIDDPVSSIFALIIRATAYIALIVGLGWRESVEEHLIRPQKRSRDSASEEGSGKADSLRDPVAMDDMHDTLPYSILFPLNSRPNRIKSVRV